MGDRKGDQSNIPGSFDSRRDPSLMPGTITRNPTRNNLTPFCYKMSKCGIVLIVYSEATISTKPTYLLPLKCLLSPISYLSLPQKNTSLKNIVRWARNWNIGPAWCDLLEKS